MSRELIDELQEIFELDLDLPGDEEYLAKVSLIEELFYE